MGLKKKNIDFDEISDFFFGCSYIILCQIWTLSETQNMANRSYINGKQIIKHEKATKSEIKMKEKCET